MTPEDAKKRRHRNERIAASLLVLLCAGAAGGVWWWNQRSKEELQSDLTYIPKPVAITPEMRLLQEFVRIDTSTPEGVARGARWIADFLQRHGIRAEIIESAPGRLNVYARIEGKRDGGALLLFNHIDVVPPGDGWKGADPFEAKVVTNVMIGRGTLDMKAMTICQLLAMADLVRSGRTPEHDLVFLATADEESGSDYGMKWLIANRRDVFEGVAYGITEGGITEMMTEKMTYFGIETGGKQVVELTLEGDDLSAIQRARIALEPYMYPRDPGRVLPEVRTYLRTIAPTRFAFEPYLADIDRTIQTGEFWRLPATYRDLTQSTVRAYGAVEQEKSWTMFVLMANLPDEIPERRIDWIRGVVAPYGVRIREVHRKEGPVPISPSDTPLFRILAGEASRRYGTPAGPLVLYRSATDSRFVRTLGIACYGVSPYPVDYFQSLTMHKANERIGLEAFLKGIGYMKSVITQWSQHS